MESLKISVDLKRRTNEVLSLQQGYTYPVELSVFDNGTAYTCTGATAQVHFLKSTGKFSIKTTDITINGNKVSFKLDNTLINRGGVGQLQVVLTKGGDVFGSWAIHCNVFANVIQDEATEDSNIIDVLGDLTKNIAKADPLSKALEKQIPQATPLTNSLKTQIPQATELVNEMKLAIEEGGTVDKRELGGFKKGYTGKEYDNLDHRINGDIDHVQQQINDSSLLPYEGTNIKADNTYYGLTKEATVKGRTLQNLVSKANRYYYSENNKGLTYFTTKTVYTLKRSTLYTIIIHDINFIDKVTNFVCVERSDNTSNSGSTRNFQKKGKTIIANFITSDTEQGENYIVIPHLYANNNDLTEEIHNYTPQILILEGDYTNTPIEELPFVEGIQGTGDLSKNLFNIKSATSGHIRADGTLNTSATNNIASIKMNVTSSKLYAQTIGGHQNGGYFSFYDSNDTFISTTYRTNNAEMIVPSNAKKFIFHTQYFNSITDYSEEAFNNANIMVSTEPIDKQLPYYDGYKISGKSFGKNLLNPDNCVLGFFYKSPINSNADTQFPCALIKVKPNTEYISNYTLSELYFEGSTNGEDYIEITNTGKGIRTTAETNYIRVRTHKQLTQEGSLFKTLEEFYNNVIISEGNVVPTYEPYQESTYSYTLDEPLRKLPNGVADSINLETGVLTRRVGKVVLDGENFTPQNHTISDTSLCRWLIYRNDNVANTNTLSICCSQYPSALPIETWLGTTKIGICQNNSGNSIYLYRDDININADGGSNRNKLIEEFKTNPLTVYYELATPTTEQLKPTQLKSFEGTTHIISNNTLQATTSVKIPSNVQMVIQDLRAENKALNVELKDTKAELENTDLDILEMNWETDFRVCELEYVIYSQEARAVSLKTNSRTISKYDQAKTLIEANRYNKTTMTRQLTVYLERGYITEEEYQELIAMME